jgi:hypothetical protein
MTDYVLLHPKTHGRQLPHVLYLIQVGIEFPVAIFQHEH